MSTSVLNSVLSMTGFGRAIRHDARMALEIEVRSVNHRFLDVSVKIPRIYNQYEPEIRKYVSSQLQRGRVEVFITRRSTDSSALAINFNRDLYDRLQVIYAGVIDPGVTQGAGMAIALDILSRREVLEVAEDNGSRIEDEYLLITETLKEALDALQSMRSSEGQHLQHDLSQRLETLRVIHKQLQDAVKRTPLEYRDRLNQRLQRLAPEVIVDPARLAAEVALMCDRIDTTEELVRLESHFSQFQQALLTGNGCGRRLEFLIQELGREFNTITSKAQDASVQHLIIEAKAEVERMKEQVQNVE